MMILAKKEQKCRIEGVLMAAKYSSKGVWPAGQDGIREGQDISNRWTIGFGHWEGDVLKRCP